MKPFKTFILELAKKRHQDTTAYKAIATLTKDVSFPGMAYDIEIEGDGNEIKTVMQKFKPTSVMMSNHKQIYRFADSTVYVDKIKKKDYQTNFIYYEVEE